MRLLASPRNLQEQRRASSTPHYQTFQTAPPKGKGRPPTSSPPRAQPPRPSAADSDSGSGRQPNAGAMTSGPSDSPLPLRQLIVLAVIALCEQTALNSISPYLPQMASDFPEVSVDSDRVGFYVGLIASSFAAAQFATNFFWGWLSDRIGRKPVILSGTIFTAAAFLAFGFCRTLWQAVVVQIFMGLCNGNQGVVSTCLGELTDRSNQSKAFSYLPVIYGIGGITGPLLGGLMAGKGFAAYPYLTPNIFSFVILFADFLFCMFFLEESLEEARSMPPLQRRISNLFAWVWQFASSARRPTYVRRYKHHHQSGLLASGRSGGMGREEVANLEEDLDADTDSASDSDTTSLWSNAPFFAETTTSLSASHVLNRDTLLLLGTYLIFQLSNISYNSLYPIFGQAAPPTGRDLKPDEIGLSLSFAGVVTIFFQIVIFNRLRSKLGNKVTYRVGLGGFVLAFFMMPWVGYKHPGEGYGVISTGKAWLWVELGFVLLVKTVATVGGLTCALLLITNSAPDHSALGTLNGLAQTLSAAGRAVGPFLSGGLFSLASKVQPKGEALVFGVFGGIAFLGLLASFGIRGSGLEAEGWGNGDASDGGDDDEDEGSVR